MACAQVSACKNGFPRYQKILQEQYVQWKKINFFFCIYTPSQIQTRQISGKCFLKLFNGGFICFLN